MKKIVIFGAGRSSKALIYYLDLQASNENWKIIVADQNIDLATSNIAGTSNSEAIECSLEDSRLVESLISGSDIVISMLPANLHIHIAKSCLRYSRNFLTASYVSDDIKELHNEVYQKSLIFLMETGLDPGLDHMSAMKEIHEIMEKGAFLKEFRSYTGGLVSPESDNTTWHYKFTWNPRNVILAGRGTATYIENKKVKYIPYHKLFERTDLISIPGGGKYEGYLNRDSLAYIEKYNLENIETFMRGTLRVSPFCSAWNCFVQLGLTADEYKIKIQEGHTWSSFIEMFLPESDLSDLKKRVSQYLKVSDTSPEIALLESTGIFSQEKISPCISSPAELLQKLLERSWKMDPQDKDMIVMQHQFGYDMPNGKRQSHSSSLIIKGDENYSAMAKTVGLPLGIACKLVLKDKIRTKGVLIPTIKELYQPILEELKGLDIRFTKG